MSRSVSLTFFLFLHLALCGQHAPAKLQAEIKRLQNDAAMRHGNWGLCVLTADSGKVIAEHNAIACLTPASTLKVLTAGAALGILGPSYRYQTFLEYDGTYDSLAGVLRGNVYIRGGGDPSFLTETMPGADTAQPVFDRWIALLQSKGVKKIEGMVIADASAFEDNPVPPGWVWSDMGNYYGAGAYGLNYRDNRYRIYFTSGNDGDTTRITRTDPPLPQLRIDNEVIAGGRKDEAFIYGAPYNFWQVASGSIPPNRKDYDVDGALPDPPLACAEAFAKQLQTLGISVSGEAQTVRALKSRDSYKPGKRRTWAVHQSAELSKIVGYTMVKSDNMYAECLLKTLALHKRKKGTLEGGLEEAKSYWASKGLDVEALYMNDGSGLSRSNALSVKQLAGAMQIASKQSWYKAFYDGLPVAGVNGSFASLCQGTAAERNLRGKSGYITRARGYTGYVKDKKGRLLTFAVLANNYTCPAAEMRKKLEKILVALAEIE